MVTQGISLALPPAELLRRLPQRAGTFLLDGGGPSSWGTGAALLGCEPAAVAVYYSSGYARLTTGTDETWSCEPPLTLLERMLPGGTAGAEGAAPSGGLLCALGYDLGRWFERLPSSPPDDFGLPVMFLAVHPWVLEYSYADRCYRLRSAQVPRRDLLAQARRLEEMSRQPPAPTPAGAARSPIRSNLTKRSYVESVRRALAYIAAGDIYQVNLAQRFAAPTPGSAPALFARLLQHHPMPYAAYVDCGAWAIVSNSPECFLQRDGDRIATFPIKGTRPRGTTLENDRERAAELARSEKDAAEHIMIVDLERNDLGRICARGSVTVPTLARVRAFPSLFHLESAVAGRLRPGISVSEILRAMFPGGSITGAPKIRAMEVIDELESVARRFYTGAVGFIDGNRWARLNIAIRTAVTVGPTVTYHTGGGIVADSNPDSEYEETLLKARAFFDALRNGIP